ncbi:MAG: hypothetical protein ACYTEQ_18455 [Planctomycetota bacterium]|jgi:hypothetical protein
MKWSGESAARVLSTVHQLWPSSKPLTELEFRAWQKGLGNFEARIVIDALEAVKIESEKMGRPAIGTVVGACKRLRVSKTSSTTPKGKCEWCNNWRIIPVRAYLATESEIAKLAIPSKFRQKQYNGPLSLVLEKVAEEIGITKYPFNLACGHCNYRLSPITARDFSDRYDGKKYLIFESVSEEEMFDQCRADRPPAPDEPEGAVSYEPLEFADGDIPF